MTSDNKKIEILLVDDEADIREVLEIALKDLGYVVRVAANGEKALHLFQTHNPSLVLTDIKMPSMDGIELLKSIKRENPECEVIMITGHGDMNLAIKSLKHEATDFITKPINVDALEISLKRAYERILIRERLKAYTRNLETLVKEKIELQDNLAALGLMVGSISHNIKGLLTGIDGGIYLVNDGIKKKNMERIQEGWGIIEVMISRIRKMAADILLHVKKREFNRKSTNLLSFVDEVAMIVEPKAREHGISFIRDFEAMPIMGNIDAGHVRTALINILENAIDACRKENTTEHRFIRFCLKTSKRYIVFSIQDNGVGMDSETLKSIFSLFYSSKGGKGTGLGLYIANKIVGEHHGTIDVESSLGKGTRFTLKIPRASK